MTIVKELLVVGAGASGLPAIRHSLFYPNVKVTCFEKSNDIGGLWNYKPYDTDLGSVMKSTVINSSKEMTSFSDFPPEDTMANYMHHTEMCRYLKNYAKHYGLDKHIKLNHSVISIERNGDYAETGKWKVRFSDGEGHEKERIFDGVLLCCGHHAVPNFPALYPGQEQFKGRIVHSHDYKTYQGYEDKVVVVVGIGNSGGDCAVELSRVSKQVYLSTRRGAWIVNRLIERGEPSDMVKSTKYNIALFSILPIKFMSWMAMRSVNARLDHEKYGLKPKHGLFQAHPTVNDELPNRIACGLVKVKPAIKSFSTHSITFTDGTTVEHVDEVIFATGYSFNFNLVEQGNLVKVDNNRVEAYKYMFPLATADHNSLGIIGLVQPVGSIMPTSEMQARVFLEHFSGNLQLPSKEEMRKDVITKQVIMKMRYVDSPRHTIQVDFLPFLHELGDMIGCSPNMRSLWIWKPMLAWKVFFGPCVPYVFRLNGPNAWDGAEQAIWDVDYRAERPTNPKIDRHGL